MADLQQYLFFFNAFGHFQLNVYAQPLRNNSFEPFTNDFYLIIDDLAIKV